MESAEFNGQDSLKESSEAWSRLKEQYPSAIQDVEVWMEKYALALGCNLDEIIKPNEERTAGSDAANKQS